MYPPRKGTVHQDGHKSGLQLALGALCTQCWINVVDSQRRCADIRLSKSGRGSQTSGAAPWLAGRGGGCWSKTTKQHPATHPTMQTLSKMHRRRTNRNWLCGALLRTTNGAMPGQPRFAHETLEAHLPSSLCHELDVISLRFIGLPSNNK